MRICYAFEGSTTDPDCGIQKLVKASEAEYIQKQTKFESRDKVDAHQEIRGVAECHREWAQPRNFQCAYMQNPTYDHN